MNALQRKRKREWWKVEWLQSTRWLGWKCHQGKKVTFWIFGRKDRRVLFHVGVRQGDKKEMIGL
jgi:hypothetical protein